MPRSSVFSIAITTTTRCSIICLFCHVFARRIPWHVSQPMSNEIFPYLVSSMKWNLTQQAEALIGAGFGPVCRDEPNFVYEPRFSNLRNPKSLEVSPYRDRGFISVIFRFWGPGHSELADRSSPTSPCQYSSIIHCRFFSQISCFRQIKWSKCDLFFRHRPATFFNTSSVNIPHRAKNCTFPCSYPPHFPCFDLQY